MTALVQLYPKSWPEQVASLQTWTPWPVQWNQDQGCWSWGGSEEVGESVLASSAQGSCGGSRPDHFLCPSDSIPQPWMCQGCSGGRGAGAVTSVERSCPLSGALPASNV